MSIDRQLDPVVEVSREGKEVHTAISALFLGLKAIHLPLRPIRQATRISLAKRSQRCDRSVLHQAKFRFALSSQAATQSL